MLKCAKCGGNYQATTYRCPARQKTQTLVWKSKAKKAQEKNTDVANKRSKKTEILVEIQRNREVTPKPVDMKLDIPINWAASPRQS